MSLTPFKFIVQAHLLQRNEEGEIEGEAATDAIVLYGRSVTELAIQFDEIIANGIKQGPKGEA
jgi:hypothetical protein